jgi:hypothetical protein
MYRLSSSSIDATANIFTQSDVLTWMISTAGPVSLGNNRSLPHVTKSRAARNARDRACTVASSGAPIRQRSMPMSPRSLHVGDLTGNTRLAGTRTAYRVASSGDRREASRIAGSCSREVAEREGEESAGKGTAHMRGSHRSRVHGCARREAASFAPQHTTQLCITPPLRIPAPPAPTRMTRTRTHTHPHAPTHTHTHTRTHTHTATLHRCTTAVSACQHTPAHPQDVHPHAAPPSATS